MNIQKPYIIAEASANHNGSFETAIGLIDMAAMANADSIKFQIIFPEGLYLTEFYVNGKYRTNPVIADRKRLMLKDGDYLKLAAHAKANNIDFSASVFDEKGLELLLECRPKYIKVASCDLNNTKFLKKVVEKASTSGISMILSTGFSTDEEIALSINVIRKTGFSNLVLLHCVSVYPAGLSAMNLSFVDNLMKYGYPVGLSDHTGGNIAAAVALAKGAMFFEKHVTLDKNQGGFDHAHSIEGPELEKYVLDINGAFEALKPCAEKLTEDEKNVKLRARRSLYAKRDIKAGETITDADILIVRPEAVMKANEAESLIGKLCVMDIKRFEPFKHNMVG